MKKGWIKYQRVPPRPLVLNLRWDRVWRLPAVWLKAVYRWLMSAQEELTPSQIAGYVACPAKYRFSRERKSATAKPHLSFYQAVHRAVIDHLRRRQAGTEPTVDELLASFQDNWDPDGFVDREEERLFYENGLRVLEKFHADDRGERRPDLVRKVVETRVDGIPLKATVDRIDKYSRKRWKAVIYKTGQRVLDGSSLAKDVTSQMLYLALRERWPRIDLEVEYHYLDPGRRVSFQLRPDEMAGARRLLHEVNRGVSEKDFPPKPGSLCGWCDFQKDCPGWRNGYVTDRSRYRLSYSKMMTYVRCPRNFRFLYVDKVAPQSRGFFSIGTSIHNALEDFYNYDGLLKQPSFPYLVKLFKKQWVNAGYEDEAEERKYFEEGLQMLRDYYVMEIDGKFRKAWATEPYFELPVGKHYIANGFIDRIDRHADGSYEVIDYKTEPKIRTQEEVDSDLQLTMYYWACREAFGFTPSKLTLHFMRHNKKITTSRTEADVGKLIATIIEVGDKATTEKNYEPLVNKYCSSCDHLKGCPKEEEVMALAKSGKTMHDVKVLKGPAVPASAGGPLHPDEEAQVEKAADKTLEKST
jgi:putative RecB family exonuclease